MLNPFNPEQNTDPGGLFAALKFQRRLFKEIQAAGVDDRIFQAVQDAFEEALKKEQIVVMPELAKKHLLAQMMKQVLMDMIGKLNNRKAA